MQLARWCSIVAAARGEVSGSAFFSNLQLLLSRTAVPRLQSGPVPLLSGCITQMVMWGLGSLNSSLVHIRYQLGLALLLRDLLKAGLPATGGLEAYDPVFSALDMAVLGECGFQVTPANPCGCHVAACPTLFYLPHCELELTERLLAANVTAGTLGNVVILGNSFSLYCERWELTHHGGATSGACGGGGSLPAARQSSQGSQVESYGSQQQRQQQHGVPGNVEAAGLDRGISTGTDGQQGASGEGLLYDLCQCGAVDEQRVAECGFPVASAFNDMALHVFLADWQARLARRRPLGW
ncbi:hypothetical protein N2152v2_004812 [Parachlorella kessleri]